jgi:sulfur carrier protein ThiS adenylyltransferase
VPVTKKKAKKTAAKKKKASPKSKASPKPQSLADRDIRYRGIVDPERLKKTAAAVIGVGAIGHQVARQLASMGVGHLLLIDHDTVDVENLGAQGFEEERLGQPKVQAVGEECGKLNSEITIEPFKQKFTRLHIDDLSLDEELIVFACVDDMDARKQIMEDVFRASALFIDGRMAAEVFSVYSVANTEDKEHYESTLFPSAEMFEAACTAKTTIYCANVISGLMVAQMTRFMRGIPVDREFQYNILTGMLRYAENEQPVEA